MIPPPPRSTLFPYTTLFRSGPLTPRLLPGGLPWGISSSFPPIVKPPTSTRSAVSPSSSSTSRSEEHTSELQSRRDLVCRLLLEKKKIINKPLIIQLVQAVTR